MKLAEEVFAEVLTDEQRQDISLGRPVYVELTREQFDAIEADPWRQMMRALDDGMKSYAEELSAKLEEALGRLGSTCSS